MEQIKLNKGNPTINVNDKQVVDLTKELVNVEKAKRGQRKRRDTIVLEKLNMGKNKVY